MAELIDRDALIEELKEWLDDEDDPEDRAYNLGIKCAITRSINAPTVEAVPVVRCKDCAKRHSIMSCPMVYYTVKGKLRLDATTDNVYCSYGIAKKEERKEQA